jgi:hypothetical protein
MSAIDTEIEAKIREFFDRNLAELQAEGGHALAPEVQRVALEQVQLYWRRLRGIAEKVTDTEVRLNLPGQKTPQGRTFGIEGIVDIVREEGRTVLYDIKTHDADSIRGNLAEYEKQLNIYAHIWQKLRGEALDETAIICTQYPPEVHAAVMAGDQAALEEALASWEPVIQVPFDTAHVDEIVRAFADVVDRIEDRQFEPAETRQLKQRLPGLRTIFAVAVCRNCDARFSCSSYRSYVLGGRGAAESQFRQYIEDLGEDIDRQDFVIAALDAAPPLSQDEIF